MSGVLTSVGWAVVLVGVALAAIVAWQELRERLASRRAARRGKAMSAKMVLSWEGERRDRIGRG